jgi:hypothetical protein
MLDQGRADLPVPTLDQAEHAGIDFAFLYSRQYGLSNDFPGARMSAVALYDNGASCRQCGGGVTSSCGKCQGKIRCAKDCNWTNRALNHAHVRSRQWLAIWQRDIMTTIQIVILHYVLREQTQLTGGPTPFTLQARLWQARFRATDFGDFFCAGLNFVRDGVQKVRALLSAGVPIAPERMLGGLRCVIYIARPPNGKGVGLPRSRRRRECGVTLNPIARD